MRLNVTTSTYYVFSFKLMHQNLKKMKNLSNVRSQQFSIEWNRVEEA